MAVALFALLLALNVADAALTARILALGGREYNPVVAFVMRKLGVIPGLALVKVAGLVVVYVWLMNPIVLAVLCALYAGIVGWNVYQFVRLAR